MLAEVSGTLFMTILSMIGIAAVVVPQDQYPRGTHCSSYKFGSNVKALVGADHSVALMDVTWNTLPDSVHDIGLIGASMILKHFKISFSFSKYRRGRQLT